MMKKKKLSDLKKLLQDLNKLDTFAQWKGTLNDLIEQVTEEIKQAPEEKDQRKGNEPTSWPLPPEVENIPYAYCLFSDGACRGNPGPGSWAHLGLQIEKGQPQHILFQASGVEMQTTNNRMELCGAIRCLQQLQEHCVDQQSSLQLPVYLFSDSKYVVEGMEKWVPSWKARGWKKADNKAPENVDLWQELDDAVQIYSQIQFCWVRGHSGHPQNEWVDHLCNQALDEAGL